MYLVIDCKSTSGLDNGLISGCELNKYHIDNYQLTNIDFQ